MKAKLIYQQGDVLLFKASGIPSRSKRLASGVLQHGEHTGHAHRLGARTMTIQLGDLQSAEALRPTFEVYEHGGVKYIKIHETTALSHEEHKTINVEPGEYEMKIVREYDHFAEEARDVVD